MSKFLGIYNTFKILIKNYGLQWAGKNSDELLIDRLTKTQNPNEVFNWIRYVKAEKPELTDFMDLIALTGIRLIETSNAYNLIIELAQQGKLETYYNAKKQCLEHYKFKDLFIRKTKKAFISFIGIDLVNRISRRPPLTSNAIHKCLQRSNIRSRFADVREAHASYLTKHLKEAEIDFLQGRVSATVFMRNYFNPNLIGDLKERTLKAIRDISEKIA